MRTHRIEVQRLTASRESRGAIELDVDVLIGPAAGPDAATSVLSLSTETARTLHLLLKTRLAEVDKRKGRSQR